MLDVGGCSGHRGHFAALLSALMASLGTLLAMRHLVFGTFVPAGLADVSAKCADRFGVGATPGHGSYSQRTNLGAIHIQCDALGHHLDVRFMQTGSSAMVTGHGTGVASFNAGVVLLTRHGGSPEIGLRRQSRRKSQRRKCRNPFTVRAQQHPTRGGWPPCRVGCNLQHAHAQP